MLDVVMGNIAASKMDIALIVHTMNSLTTKQHN